MNRSRTEPVDPGRQARRDSRWWTRRAVIAAGVLVSAGVHLWLYLDGFASIPVIGPAFMLNAIGGLLIAGAVLIWRHVLSLLAAIGFGLSTLGAYYISATVGLFGVHEPWTGGAVLTAEISEWIVVLVGLSALRAEFRSSR